MQKSHQMSLAIVLNGEHLILAYFSGLFERLAICVFLDHRA